LKRSGKDFDSFNLPSRSNSFLNARSTGMPL
jgi:hypothetical protein